MDIYGYIIYIHISFNSLDVLKSVIKPTTSDKRSYYFI